MALPHVTAVGNVVADPELRFTKAGKAVCNFRVACNDRYRKGDEWVDGDVTFLSVDVWNQAEAVAEQLRKGSAVTVSGVLTQREVERDGVQVTFYSLKASTVGAVVREFAPRPSDPDSVPPF
jgi:single-strand DNA-binding protein